MSISEVSANLWNHVYCSRSTFSKWLPTSAASQFQFADTRVAGALSRARICTKAGAATAWTGNPHIRASTLGLPGNLPRLRYAAYRALIFCRFVFRRRRRQWMERRGRARQCWRRFAKSRFRGARGVEVRLVGNSEFRPTLMRQ